MPNHQKKIPKLYHGSLDYEALQEIVYIQLPPEMNFGISLKRSEITEMGVFLVPP